MSTLVSVLLPVYNGEASVREAIESVLDQDYPNFEFVIVDNASTDGTAAIIEEYSSNPRVRVLRNEETMPRLENFVKVFASADPESRWLKFIGDDDRLLPGCLREMVEVAEKSERVGLVSSHYYDGDRLVLGALPPGQDFVVGPILLKRLLLRPQARKTVFSPASLLVSHQAYCELGGFRVDLSHADSELFYRLLNRYNFAFVHKPLTVSGYHADSGQAISTERGDTFSEAYLIRYHNLKEYDQVKLTGNELEKIKANLVNDSVGFILARLAAGDSKRAWAHLRRIPLRAFYYVPVSLVYFAGLAVRKLIRREPVKLFKKRRAR